MLSASVIVCSSRYNFTARDIFDGLFVSMLVNLIYFTCPLVGYFAFQYFAKTLSPLYSLILAAFIAYLPTYTITNHLSKHGGMKLEWVQKLPQACRFFKRLLGASINLEEKLDNNKQYIFCNFPHGTCSVNHVLTMTDCCEFLSKHHTGDRRDLAASVLFMIPVVKEVIWQLRVVRPTRVSPDPMKTVCPRI